MARQNVPAEINNFIQGLITEASPINFPPNASIDEDNFVLARDGSRSRRLGLDYETSFQEVTTSLDTQTTALIETSSYVWENAGGQAGKKILVIQVGNQVRFFDFDSSPLSGSEIHLHESPSSKAGVKFSYAVVDGVLVMADGQEFVTRFSYESGVVVLSVSTLKIRDLFGVEDISAETGKDLFSGSGIMERPLTLTQPHEYNLRNQTWALPRMDDEDEILIDPLNNLFSEIAQYPSNADNANSVIYANANDAGNRTAPRFNPKDLQSSSTGSEPAPRGFFIIDAFNRGASRLSEITDLSNRELGGGSTVVSLPADRTPGGPTTVAEYSGRLWYAGFPGEVVGGDKRSPLMSSYVLFSQVVRNIEDIGKCYQDADPTSLEDPTLVATDGGFIRIDGAYNIQRMVNLGPALVVFAENGVWQISGGSDFGFAADNNFVKKITDRGITSPSSAVLVENAVFYWGDDAIYQVAPNQFGELSATNVSTARIQGFYDDIDSLDKASCTGIFDSYDRKVRWLYGNRIGAGAQARELVLDMELSAYYPSTPRSLPSGFTPLATQPVRVPPFMNLVQTENVVNGGVLVEDSGEQVIIESSTREEATREVAYMVVTSESPVKFTFASYSNLKFLDWEKADNVGVDADAFLLTGWTTGGDNQRTKQVPWLTFYMRATETGYTTTPEGDIAPVNEGSCLLQTRWDWTNSDRANRWSRDLQLYRRRRSYFPEDVSEEFDDGHELVISKNKLRGKGRSVAFYLKTEAGKDCNILGWSFIIGINGNV